MRIIFTSAPPGHTMIPVKPDDPDPPPVLDYGRPEQKPVGQLSHKIQYPIMYGIAAAIAVVELTNTACSLPTGDLIAIACIPVFVLVGNHHLNEYRKRR